jgi:type I restriction enzyme R subunit
VHDGFLVPPKAVSVPLKFQREGIRYDELPEEDKDQWDALEWDDDGNVPNRVEAEAVNKWLFNKDTADKVLEHLDDSRPDGGRRRSSRQDHPVRQEPAPR